MHYLNRLILLIRKWILLWQGKSRKNSDSIRKYDNMWLSVILISSALALAGNISILITEVSIPADLLFYIPVILATAVYVWYGFFFSVVLSALYLITYAFYPHTFTDWIFAIFRATTMVAVSGIIAWYLDQSIEAKMQLFNTLRQYKRIADYTYNWEYWSDHEGNILYMSPAVRRITGYRAEQFMRDPDLFNRIIHPQDLLAWQNHKAYSHDFEPERKALESEFRIITASGEIRWIGHVCRRLYDEYGKYQGLRVSNRDISAQVEAEEKLLELSLETEKKERNFYSSEIHDRLGPLLSTIKLYFQWLSETNDIEKAKMITEKGNQSLDVAIDTLREISHNMSSQNLDRSGFVKALQYMADRINSTQKISIKIKTNTSERFDKTKEVALYYIVSELINNTIKHADAKKIMINIQAKNKENMIYITYQDDGNGFVPEDLQNHNETSTGLGLLSIQQRMKLLRGRFQMKSAISEGFYASLELPL